MDPGHVVDDFGYTAEDAADRRARAFDLLDTHSDYPRPVTPCWPLWLIVTGLVLFILGLAITLAGGV